MALMLAAAAGTSPYKLILSVNGQPVVIDYPSAERCERAQSVAEAEVWRRWEEAQRNKPPGTILTKPAITISGLCIPA